MVRAALPLGKGRFGGADVEAAAELQRIGVDDFGVKGGGDFERQSAFTDGGGADYGTNLRHSSSPFEKIGKFGFAKSDKNRPAMRTVGRTGGSFKINEHGFHLGNTQALVKAHRLMTGHGGNQTVARHFEGQRGTVFLQFIEQLQKK